MKKQCSGLIIIFTVLLVTASCKKTTYTYPGPFVKDYYTPLQVGKYITYRLDSLTFYYYGQLDTLTSYLAKDSVEAVFTDNARNTVWRVVRYLNNITGTGAWTPGETYMVTPSTRSIEISENNLRSVNLAFPINEGYSWRGSTYLPYDPYKSLFLFSDNQHLNVSTWNYTYKQVNKPFTVINKAYDSTVTVLQVNDSTNVPIIDRTSFGSKSYWAETYAKNIGLIYRRTQIWEYQPATPDGTQHAYKIGFEMTLSIVDHN